MEDVLNNMDNIIHQVTNLLPKSFSQQISESIFAGMRQVKIAVLYRKIRPNEITCKYTKKQKVSSNYKTRRNLNPASN